jgi:hypothetical protein
VMPEREDDLWRDDRRLTSGATVAAFGQRKRSTLSQRRGMMHEHTGIRFWRSFHWGSAFKLWLGHADSRYRAAPWEPVRTRSARRPQAVRMVPLADSDGTDAIPTEPNSTACADADEQSPSNAAVSQAAAEVRAPTPLTRVESGRLSRQPDEPRWEAARATYRDIWQQGRGRTGGDWDDAEPGYHYGFDCAMDAHLQGRSWPQVEAELTSGFADWAQRHGYDPCWTTWGNVREHVRDVWEELGGPMRISRLRRRAS